MSKKKRKNKDLGVPKEDEFFDPNSKKFFTIEARNSSQKNYLKNMRDHTITFGVGPAGTGKTYLCGAVAANDLINGKVEKIVITRPVVEAEEALGFLPGTLEEKFAPYFRPFKDVLDERLGNSHTEYLLKRGVIEIAPLAYMRGRSFKNCWVILDEAQNTTPNQMKLFLTRLGEGCKVVINGDICQKDIKGNSGLENALEVLKSRNIGFTFFTKEDIVRSKIVQEVVDAYDEFENIDLN